MNYRPQNNRDNQNTWKPVIVTCVILALAGIFYFFAPNFTSETLYTIARPIWNAESFVVQKFTDIASIIKDKKRLTNENITLQRELDETRATLLTLDAYKKENEDLKALAGRTSSDIRVLAVILAKPNSSTYDSLILDVGKNNGIRAGDTVAVGDYIIGTVHDAYPNYSKAILFSNPGETINVRIGAGISASATGRGGGNFLIKLPKEIPVKVGDSVSLPEINIKLFGIVENIDVTETSSFQYILFKLPVNVNSLNWVEVIKQP